MVALLALALTMRVTLLSMMRKLVPSAELSDKQALSPIELAFLLRPDDSAHCLIVLIVDDLQKGLKSPHLAAEELASRHYEVEVWNVLREYIKGWTMQKAQSIVPAVGTGNPVKIAFGFWKLRHWFVESFKSLFSDIIKDPHSLKRYFSPAGLMRVFFSLLSSGIKEPLVRNLRGSLLQRNLLVPDSQRSKYSGHFRLLSGLQMLAALLLVAFVSGVSNYAALFLFCLCAAFNGVVLRVLAEIPAFLPFYDEVSLVLDSVGRKGFRVNLFRQLLKTLRTIFWSLIAVLAVVLLAVQSWALSSFAHLASSNLYLVAFGLVALTMNFLCIAESAFLSIAVATHDQLSDAGKKLVAQYKTQLKSISPLTAFSTMLSAPQYDEQLSEIVAIYGIETLFLLA
jgi:hypothetical protein